MNTVQGFFSIPTGVLDLLKGGKLNRCMLFFFIASFVLFLPNIKDAACSEEKIENSSPKSTYQIVIRVADRKLRLYEKNGEDTIKLLKEYDVATAFKGLDPQPMGAGRITKIEFNPPWYPPPVTRATFKEKGIDLPAVVPPKHPLNFMGAFKIHLSHCTARGCFYRIHGNNDKSKIGKRVTGGCVRMYNEEGMALARLVPVGTKVIFEP